MQHTSLAKARAYATWLEHKRVACAWLGNGRLGIIAYSHAGAWSAFKEDERGTLAVGNYADFPLLDADPFTVSSERIPEIRVRGPWHEGRQLEAPPPDIAGFALKALTTKRRLT